MSLLVTVNVKWMVNVLNNNLRSFSVVVIGISGVGKSALIRRFTRGDFAQTSESTVGVAFLESKLTVSNWNPVAEGARENSAANDGNDNGDNDDDDELNDDGTTVHGSLKVAPVIEDAGDNAAANSTGLVGMATNALSALTLGGSGGDKEEGEKETLVRLMLWDTAGQERYAPLMGHYLRGARAAIACFDIWDRSSWDRLSDVVRRLVDIEPACERIYIVGCKTDGVMENPMLALSGTPTRIAHEMIAASDLVFSHGGRRVFYTSSRTGDGVRELFHTVAADAVHDARAKAGQPVDGGDDDAGGVDTIRIVPSGYEAATNGIASGGGGGGSCCFAGGALPQDGAPKSPDINYAPWHARPSASIYEAQPTLSGATTTSTSAEQVPKDSDTSGGSGGGHEHESQEQ